MREPFRGDRAPSAERKRGVTPSVPSPPRASAVALQRMIGNRATSSLLAGRIPPVRGRQLLRQPETEKDPIAAEKAKLAALVAKKKWRELATQLATFSDADMTSRMPDFPRDAFGDFVNFLMQHPGTANDRVFARATFVNFQREHPRERPTTNVKEGKQGKQSKGLKVPGGEVTVQTGETYALIGEDVGDSHDHDRLGYSVTYKGTDSERSRWIQFVWFEAIADVPGGPAGGKPLAFQVPASTIPMNSTTDHANQDVIVDARGSSPFYEDSGANNRTANSTTIFDAPSSQSSAFEQAFSGATPATKVTATAHMIQYLVRDDQVLCRVNLEVKWVFADPKVPTPVFTEPRLKAATALNPEHRRKLQAQIPTFTWIP